MQRIYSKNKENSKLQEKVNKTSEETILRDNKPNWRDRKNRMSVDVDFNQR